MASNNTTEQDVIALFPDNNTQEISASDMRAYVNAIFSDKEVKTVKIDRYVNLSANNTNIYEGTLVIFYGEPDISRNGIYISKVNQPTVVSDLIRIAAPGIADPLPAYIGVNDVYMDERIGNPANIDRFGDIYNHFYSAGILGGCDLTDNGDGSISLTEGSCTLRAPGDTGHGIVYSVEVPSVTDLILIDKAINYVYVAYNDGVTITWNVTSIDTDVNMVDTVPAYIVVRNGNNIGYMDARSQNVDHTAKNSLKEFYTQPLTRKNGGAIVSDAGTLHLACSAGAFYFQLNEYPLPALDTTGVDTFIYYSHLAGVWTEVPSQIIDNTSYDDGSNLVPIANNKFGVHWIYGIIGNSPKYVVVYGTQEYANLAEAQASSAPASLPVSVQGLGVLLGRAVIEKGATELSVVETVFDTSFSSSLAATHNNLSNIQGGIVNEYYHLTSAEYTALVSGTRATDLTFTDTLTGVVLTAPDSTKYRITVDNAGTLITTIV